MANPTSNPPVFKGYEAFSNFIASDPELELYRNFRKLSSRNLLYLQSCLLELEAKLKRLDQRDSKLASMERPLRSWEDLSEKSQQSDPRESESMEVHKAIKERMEVLMAIKERMKEYQEALLLQIEVLKLPKPNVRVFRVFQRWFSCSRPFMDLAFDMVNEENREDFVALYASPNDDLARIFQEFWGRYLPSTRSGTAEDVKYYSSKGVTRLVTVITVLAASLVMEGAIVALYLIKSQKIRLGLSALFISLFAASMAILTNAERSNIILATAACAAVLVVFISSA